MVRIFYITFLAFFTCSLSAHGADSITIDQNTRRSGGDYTSFSTANARQCAEFCQKSSRCQAFDFYNSDHSCWLKSTAYPAGYYVGAVSGSKQHKAVRQQPSGSENIEVHYDTQRPGGDYVRFQVRDARECENRCAEDSRCAAFDFTSSDYFCYLKSWVPRARYYRGIVSGVKTVVDNQVKSVQELLARQHYNVGVADGVMGRNTGLALENYQRDHGLSVTGRIDNATLLAMGFIQQPAPAVPPPQYAQPAVTEETIEPVKAIVPAAPVADQEIPKERWPTRAELQKSSAAEVEQNPVAETQPQNLLLQVRTMGVTYMQMTANIYADVLGTIPAGTVLQVISQTDGWYKVSYQNQAGYVLAESVEKL